MCVCDLQTKIEGLLDGHHWFMTCLEIHVATCSVQLRSTPNVPIAAKVDLKGSIPLHSLETKCSYFLCIILCTSSDETPIFIHSMILNKNKHKCIYMHVFWYVFLIMYEEKNAQIYLKYGQGLPHGPAGNKHCSQAPRNSNFRKYNISMWCVILIMMIVFGNFQYPGFQEFTLGIEDPHCFALES